MIDAWTRPVMRASARFFKSEAKGSVLLLICTIAALTWANSPWSDWYFQLVHAKIGFSWNDSKFVLSGEHWINDGLMALFFSWLVSKSSVSLRSGTSLQ